jgi:MFS family permease
MTPADAKQTVFAYEQAFGWVFSVGAIAMALCFLICGLISDHGLQREEIMQKERRMSAEHL